MIKRILFIACLMLTSVTAFGHPGHDGNVSEQELIVRAKFNIGLLVEKNKLDESWQSQAEFQSMEKRYAGEEVEYKLMFANPQIKDTAKANLYVFLTAAGEYVAANFSGK